MNTHIHSLEICAMNIHIRSVDTNETDSYPHSFSGYTCNENTIHFLETHVMNTHIHSLEPHVMHTHICSLDTYVIHAHIQ